MLSKIMGGVGRTLMTVGTLMLLFVAYQLWGTGIQEARSQNDLRSEFSELLARAEKAPSTATTNPPKVPISPDATTTAPSPSRPLLDGCPKRGKPVAEIHIPKIGITRTVVEGETVRQLKRGVGHNPSSPLPGQKGNVSMAGHRTTYGQPFHNVDKLSKGDLIEFTTIQGRFTYKVDDVFIVKPNDVQILEDKGDNRVTLVACHPKYSLAERIIVTGQLVGNPVAEIAGQAKVREKAAKESQLAGDAVGGSLSGESQARTPVAIWFLVCVAIWLATWLVQGFLRRRLRARSLANDRTPSRSDRLLTWAPYLAGVPIFLVALYFFFENFSLLLPGNY